jgi:hypothetical protein
LTSRSSKRTPSEPRFIGHRTCTSRIGSNRFADHHYNFILSQGHNTVDEWWRDTYTMSIGQNASFPDPHFQEETH